MSKKINWDGLGISASLVCAIHCALMPLFFTSLPVFGINIINNVAFEIFMVLLAFIVGIFSLYHGYRKHHRSFVPILIFSVGFVFLVLKLLMVAYEKWLLVPAVAGIVLGHIINYKSCQVQRHTTKENRVDYDKQSA